MSSELEREEAVEAQVRTMYNRARIALYRGLESVIREGGMTVEEALIGLDAIDEELANDFEHWHAAIERQGR